MSETFVEMILLFQRTQVRLSLSLDVVWILKNVHLHRYVSSFLYMYILLGFLYIVPSFLQIVHSFLQILVFSML